MKSRVELLQPDLDGDRFSAAFDREPIGFTHGLSQLSLFRFDHLVELCRRYASSPADYFVAEGAPAPDADFYIGPPLTLTPLEAVQRLDSGSYRILLKRLENHDEGFRELLHRLFEQVMALRGGLKGERVVRLESAVFISSAASTTPFHFDPEVNFFMQIEGEKTYHVYPPAVLSEAELERFYVSGIVHIAQVDLKSRDPRTEHVFKLAPGKGLHQPQNAPHWVETGSTRSISYSFVYETDGGRARGRVRAFNHYSRKLGMSPIVPGFSVALDSVKSNTMRLAMPARNGLRSVLRSRSG